MTEKLFFFLHFGFFDRKVQTDDIFSKILKAKNFRIFFYWGGEFGNWTMMAFLIFKNHG